MTRRPATFFPGKLIRALTTNPYISQGAKPLGIIVRPLTVLGKLRTKNNPGKMDQFLVVLLIVVLSAFSGLVDLSNNPLTTIADKASYARSD
jgi:hypothetical protein